MTATRKTILLAICLYMCVCSSIAQDGRWVTYDLGSFGSGYGRQACGDGLVIYTQSASQYVIVFDVAVGEWSTFNLGSTHDFVSAHCQSSGNVAMTNSSTMLIGYSAITQTWDTITYTGTLLDDSYNAPQRSYGCSRAIGYFITDQEAYIFDAELGEWQGYAFGLPDDFTSGLYWARNDYFAMSLSTLSNPYTPTSVVYSSHTQTFNRLEKGFYKPTQPMHHGSAGVSYPGGMGDTVYLVGYSAFDNQFDTMTYLPAEGESSRDFFELTGGVADSTTVFSHGFASLVPPDDDYRTKYYSYDTRRGDWDTTSYIFDRDIERPAYNGQTGGQFTSDFTTYKADQHYHFLFYQGNTGAYFDISPDLRYTSTSSGFTLGGSIFAVFDTLSAWVYDFSDGIQSAVYFNPGMSANFHAGEDYATISRYRTDQDDMTMYFFNGNTNNWSSIITDKETSLSSFHKPHLFMSCDGPEHEAIFYSSYRDEIMTHQFPSVSFVSYGCGGVMGAAYSSDGDTTVLFDGLTGAIVGLPFDIDLNGLGCYSAAFFNDADSTLYGYSPDFGGWATLKINTQPYLCRDTGYIGVVGNREGFLNYTEWYAFNGYSNAWVPLAPQGDHKSFAIGYNTALVERTTHLYAFDPQHPPLNADNAAEHRPDRFELSQNYPNPFNPSTRIDFTLDRRSRVELTVFNILGQQVRTLIDDEKSAGSYSILWGGRNNNGHRVTSGVYLYRLKTNNNVRSKRMVLIK